MKAKWPIGERAEHIERAARLHYGREQAIQNDTRKQTTPKPGENERQAN